MGKMSQGTTLKNFVRGIKKRWGPNKNSTVIYMLSSEEIHKDYNKYGILPWKRPEVCLEVGVGVLGELP